MRPLRIIFAVIFLAVDVFAVIWLSRQIQQSPHPLENPLLFLLCVLGLMIPTALMRLFKLLERSPGGKLRDPQAILQFKESPTSRWFTRLAGLVILFMAALLMRDYHGDTNQALSAGFMAFIGIAGIAMSFRTKPAELTLSPDGLFYNRFKGGLIAWEDIRTAKPKRLVRQKMVVLELRDTAKYDRFLAKWGNRGEITLLTENFGVRAEDIVEAVEARCSVFSF
jgi:hypothetical protein